MSTNKTKNYQLHQWAPSDPVSLPEVNGNFAALDAAVAGVQEAAAQAEEAAAELPYVVGSYTGTGKTGNKVSLPFHPSYLIIGCPYGSSDTAASYDAVLAFGAEGYSKVITIEDDGFTPILSTKYPRLNASSTNYFYIAFR
jgi:hypothetical protein